MTIKPEINSKKKMLIKIVCYYYFFYLSLSFKFRGVSPNESQQTCAVELKNSMPMLKGVRNIELAIDASLKQETINSRLHLSELIKAEFELQREEMLQLEETAKTEESELNNITKELGEQKVLVKNLIDNELSTQIQEYKKYVKNELDAVCGKGNVAQNQKLSEKILNNFSSQEKTQNMLVEGVMKAFVPIQIDSSRYDKNFNCTENCGPVMDLPDSCEKAMSSSFSKDGVYLLHIPEIPLKPFFVYCKRIDSKIWTIMQRREDGSVDFYRNWNDYKHGFGNLYGELWLGLERLHVMTTKHKHKLHVWMENRSGRSIYGQYNKFSIADETEKYRLEVDDYAGSACDRLTQEHNGTAFSTYDRNNDKTNDTYSSCAKHFKGAWWFSKCYISHLNGVYNTTEENGIDWNDFDVKLKYTQMAISRA